MPRATVLLRRCEASWPCRLRSWSCSEYGVRGTEYALDVFSPSTVVAVLVRPYLWPTAIGAVFALARRGWWKRPPFLPIPDSEMVRWRVTTAYGQPDMALESADVLSYLRWRRQA